MELKNVKRMNTLTIMALTAVLMGGGVSCNMEGADSAESDSQYESYASYVSYVISVAELQDSSVDGRALIDLGSPEYGYWVEPGVDHASVDVRCPSMGTIRLEQWIEDLGISSAQWDDGLFIYSVGEDKGQVQKNACASPCVGDYHPGIGWDCLCP